MSEIGATREAEVADQFVAGATVGGSCVAREGEDLDPDDESAILDASSKLKGRLESPEKTRNYIIQLIFEMEDSLIKLNAKDLTIAKLEEMAVFIYESMSISTRNYHSVQHVFDIINHDKRLQMNPIAILAACFHDCIYYHVDGGLTQVQAMLLRGSYKVEGPSIEKENNSDFITKQSSYNFFATDREEVEGSREGTFPYLRMVETIFGYTPGQNIRITNDGLNEFLSAVVAVRMLKDHLPIEILAQIACCIEATIPFRPDDKLTGKSHMARLHDNMKEARQISSLKLTDEDLVTSVQRACLLSNSDVGNFGTTDRHWFLDNTWSLLPETNESLRNEYVYSVEHFHIALFKMYSFFGFLQPEVVFHDFMGVPAIDEMDQLTQECTNNLEFGRTYVGAKLVAMSLVSAVAVLTGGDAPISLFTGDLRASERRGSQPWQNQNLGRFQLASQKTRPSDFCRNPSIRNIPASTGELPSNCNQLVYEILAEGRRSESSFDTKRSPWAAQLYRDMGCEGLDQVLKDHALYPMTTERAWGLLRALPLHPVHFIVTSIAEQALSRSDKILDVLTRLHSDSIE